ncbi:hypothetical protein EYF80_017385 [Liparis tanakae]|uniref:Uncharacterized protein n=1 Tax=Liparis tanakae TaxID=230148 RepID=A0A4Z2I2Q1_9TELE|nr:hypothetical protein EYF80_017385 [Liparis tanakae]
MDEFLGNTCGELSAEHLLEALSQRSNLLPQDHHALSTGGCSQLGEPRELAGGQRLLALGSQLRERAMTCETDEKVITGRRLGTSWTWACGSGGGFGH